MPDYIRWLRARVGHDHIQLAYAAACVVTDGRVLMHRRSDDGQWGLPGGAIELGESGAAAVVREVAEETGVRVEIEALQGVYTAYRHVYPNGDVVQPITVFFRCAPVGGRLGGDAESLEVRYFDLDATPELTNPVYLDALDDLRAGRLGVYR
ncbi:NUDIX domain-containing protein [Nocardia amikacinitolerans]|uniref:NUDIX domain-containing protein n=1 Tax=Nocardia amikacinitolerans TaxID=756689 RepID=UPI0020A4342F|nr:NUDIX domain-containing protein [Nocardia amikacinitolerans]MCP2280355.1 ADP-ribose pyrophosphatase YjhB, NUDIX family [Nocardia amikacinitolerans]